MSAPTTASIHPLHHFIGDFATWVKEEHDIRYCFIVGAGASRSSGIPTGAVLVDKWLLTRYQQEHPGAPQDGLASWAEAHPVFRGWVGPRPFWPERAAFYGRIYEWFFHDKATGQAELRTIMRDKSPSFGYSVLSAILAKTAHRVVLTTNFDNLVRDALTLHAPDTNPFVCHGQNDARFLAGHSRRVRIVKLHGDIDRETYNAAAQIDRLEPGWEAALRGIFTDYTPIFVGYGGNDPGFMRFMIDLPREQFRARPLWAYRVDPGGLQRAAAPIDAPPGWPDNGMVHEFMERHNGLWLPIPGFDELMLLLSDALRYDNQAARIRAEADRRAKDYEGTLGAAVKGLRDIPHDAWCPQIGALAAAAELRLFGEARRRSWDEWRVILASVSSNDEKKRMFEQALTDLKDSPELNAAYASFLVRETPNSPRGQELIQQARALAEASSGPDSPAALEVGHHASIVEAFSGSIEKAIALGTDVMNRRTTVLGAEHPDTLATISALASFVTEAGELQKAESLHRRAVEAQKRTLGAEHADTLSSMNRLANNLLYQERFDEADGLYQHVLEVRRRLLGPMHVDTIVSVGNLAISADRCGREDEAKQLLERAANDAASLLGPEHAVTLGHKHNLAIFLRDHGAVSEAAALAREVLDARRRVMSPNDRAILDSIGVLGTCLSRLDRGAEAETLLREVVERRTREHGDKDPATFGSRLDLAIVLEQNGKKAEALALLQMIVGAPEHALPPKHSLRAVAATMLQALQSDTSAAPS